MRLQHLISGFGALVLGLSWGAVRADPAQPPKNVKVEPSTPRSEKLTTRAATAEMSGDPQAALKLAERAISANRRDPWGYYDKGSALARLGETDGALVAFSAAEETLCGLRPVGPLGGYLRSGTRARRGETLRRGEARVRSLCVVRSGTRRQISRYGHEVRDRVQVTVRGPGSRTKVRSEFDALYLFSAPKDRRVPPHAHGVWRDRHRRRATPSGIPSSLPTWRRGETSRPCIRTDMSIHKPDACCWWCAT